VGKDNNYSAGILGNICKISKIFEADADSAEGMEAELLVT
jgi:hypothetical protein